MTNPLTNRRKARVAESIKTELARLLTQGTNNPSLAWVTLTDVVPSPDLKYAKVFFITREMDKLSDVQASLEKAAPFFQRELGRVLRTRNTPKLTFRHDLSFVEGGKIDQLIGEVRGEDNERIEKETPEKCLARLVAESRKVLICTHRNPDGDAIGSLLGMRGILELIGKNCIAYCPDGIPKVLGFLHGADRVVTELEVGELFDLTILLDTGGESLIPAGFPDEGERGTLVVIDHHMSSDQFGDLIIRRASSAVGEILFDLSKQLVWPIDAKVAECLYASIVADTRSFRYSSTTPHTHMVAAELIDQGARPWVVATALYESYPVHRQKLLGQIASTIEVSEDGRFAQMHSTPETLDRVGAKTEDLDGMVNLGRSIDTVEIAALLRLDPNGQIKVSFRSKGKYGVSDLAEKLGGGGHRNAAGCTLHGMTIEQARIRIAKYASELLAEKPNN